MKTFIVVAGLSLACCAPLWAQTPDIEFSAGGDSATLPLSLQSDGTWGITPGTDVTLSNGVTFTVNSIQVNSDPYVFYSYSVKNTSSSTMSYTANLPVTMADLPPGPYTVSSSLGITLTNGTPNTTVWISPDASTGAIQQGLIGGNDAGVDLGTAMISNSTFGYTATQNYTGGPLTYNLPPPGATEISFNEVFDLSAGASVGLSGFFDVESTPEPSSGYLGLAAMGAFMALIYRARRSRA